VPVSANTIRIASADGSTVAEFVPEAGMLCCSFEHDGRQLLDPRKGVDAYATRGSTMGVPLLYPWANRLEAFEYSAAGKTVSLPRDLPVDPNDLPIHGAIPGRMRWEADATDSTISARLEWSLLELFPYAHEVGLEISVAGRELSIATTVRAQEPTPVSFGYHPYLTLGSDRRAWRVRLPALERLTLDDRSIPTGAREPFTETEFELADSSWDDGFVVSSQEQAARFDVSDPSGRGIAVEFERGYPYAQVFAPPGNDFICFEPMTAPTNALRSGDGLSVVAAGEEYRAVFTVRAR
jgi:aldose 1-epimerase